MNTIRIGTLVLLMLNIYFSYADPGVKSDVTKNIRDKRDHYYSEGVGNFYSNFNEPDNAITTVLPLLDTDGTSKVANDVPTDNDDGEDDALVSHSLDDEFHYFRPNPDSGVEGKLNYDWNNDDTNENRLDVRGKKNIPFYPLRLYPKRAPSGFLGLRGKKYYYNGAKRVPSGFTGMRGKKAFYDMNSSFDDNTNQLELTKDIHFDELLQRERAFLEELYRIHQIEQEISNNPSISTFQTSEKRAPSGFLGMRGKKATEDSSSNSETKRAPSGFLGLRGKRANIDDYIEGNKRTTFTSYFGMQGNKEPLSILSKASGYFRGRGKKYKYLGSFIGVRGKRFLEVTKSTVN
ncbi:tachykinins isoform X2 [Aedes aegypti]|uniref:Uncharacterized protein n=1 Tax=Aedes aegypti TaxID=7159 RepID=A0A6I8T971_AEDAE|nr:tachykinins isoform X2 [Aedes aegypti]